MKTIKGDLIELAGRGRFDVIVHGCNCFHTFGAGIARTIRLAFPKAYEADLTTKFADKDKLGSLSMASFFYLEDGKEIKLTILNAYTQFGIGTSDGKPPVDYGAVELCFQGVKKLFGGMNLRFGIPKIGAGLGGGDWEIISDIIDTAMHGEDLTLVLFE